MKEIDFPEWTEVLAQAVLPEREKRSFEITLRWYLSFCRRGRAAVTSQSARDFIEWAQRENRPEPWQVEQWKEAIRWFFREAQRAGQASHAGAVGGRQPETPPPAPDRNVAAGSETYPGWKAAFLTVVRRRNYSYRTEQSSDYHRAKVRSHVPVWLTREGTPRPQQEFAEVAEEFSFRLSAISAASC